MMDNTGTIDWSKVTKFVSLLLYIQSVSLCLLITPSLDMSIRNIYIRRKEKQNINRQPTLYLRFCIKLQKALQKHLNIILKAAATKRRSLGIQFITHLIKYFRNSTMCEVSTFNAFL